MKLESGLGRIRDMKHPLAVLILAGLAVRLVLMPLFSFNIDLTYWMKVFNLIDGGNDLYSIGGYYYTPVWGYILGAMDMLAHVLGFTDFGTQVPELYPYVGMDYSISPYVTSVSFNVLVKVPLILTDIAVAYLLYTFVMRISDDRNKALLACVLWVLCPLTILESSVHAMFDNISAMFMLISFIAAYDKKYLLAGGVYSLAILTKFFPLFFIFLLLAIVVRNEGFNMRSIRGIAMAIASAVAVMLIVEFPAIINGQFWESVSFMTERIGLSASTLESLGIWLFVGLGILVFLVAAAAHYFCRIRPDIIRSRFLGISDEDRNRKVLKVIKIVAGVMTALILLYSAYSVIKAEGTLVDIFNVFAKRVVLLLSVYTLLLEAYIAYRFLFSRKEGIMPYIYAFAMSAAVIFLWPPAPQYAIVIVPAFVLLAVFDGRFAKPFVIMTVLMALYDIVLAGPSAVFSLAVYTDLMDISSLVPMVEFVTSYIFGELPTIAPFMLVFGGASYVSLLYLIYRGIILGRRGSE